MTDFGRIDPERAAQRQNGNKKAPSLNVTYCTDKQIQSICSGLRSGHQSLMGVVGFSQYMLTDPVPPVPFIQVPLAPIEDDALFELWTTDEPVSHEQNGQLHCSYGSTLLFGCLTFDSDSGADLALSTEHAYRFLFSHIDRAGYGNLLRIWHYIPHITEDSGGLERYQSFNSGRYRAFSAHQKEMKAAPAASALGSPEGSLAIYFIASKSPGHPLENQRQISAYNYPKEYGPYSPIFSRAMWFGDQLFISGTASIVGHASMYEGDLAEQTRETITNLSALLANASDGILPSSGIQLKAYLRYPEHLSFVRKALSDAFGVQTSVAFFQAQICRRELLLEIEGIWKAGASL
ncbi:MAG: chorismate transformation enzyme, FkbO/Hyg5 family [Leptospirales bacterium]